MKLLEPIVSRRSIRKFKDEPVTDEQVELLLRAAHLAPSGSNTQPSNYIVVRSEEVRRKVMEVSHEQKWMMQAPVFIVCVADLGVRIKEGELPAIDEESPLPELKLILRDATIGVDHLVLQAAHMGLGTCWVAWFKNADIRPVLGIPDNQYVVAVIPVGVPDQSPKPRPRKDFDSMVYKEKWGER
ncbi:nitroreductase family protein [Salidesulfovibrio onnuriiensis]|uniref:nitroreductase family protein n=1 Tax=Salidesulfovibrio onnuriiensis TaxID=2583823 RepID=UPI001C9C83E0|nr:nitroreductase family protein [Salidesulfovibrio onnuriiensis]